MNYRDELREVLTALVVGAIVVGSNGVAARGAEHRMEREIPHERDSKGLGGPLQISGWVRDQITCDTLTQVKKFVAGVRAGKNPGNVMLEINQEYQLACAFENGAHMVGNPELVEVIKDCHTETGLVKVNLLRESGDIDSKFIPVINLLESSYERK